MAISKDHIKEFSEAYEKEHGRTLTEEEVQRCIEFLEMLAHVQFEYVYKESARRTKLEDFPKGFHLDESGTCTICGDIVKGEIPGTIRMASNA